MLEARPSHLTSKRRPTRPFPGAGAIPLVFNELASRANTLAAAFRPKSGSAVPAWHDPSQGHSARFLPLRNKIVPRIVARSPLPHNS